MGLPHYILPTWIVHFLVVKCIRKYTKSHGILCGYLPHNEYFVGLVHFCCLLPLRFSFPRLECVWHQHLTLHHRIPVGNETLNPDPNTWKEFNFADFQYVNFGHPFLGFLTSTSELVGAEPPPPYCSIACHLVQNMVILAAHDCSSLITKHSLDNWTFSGYRCHVYYQCTKGNPSRSPNICCRCLIPKWVPFNDPCQVDPYDRYWVLGPL